MQHFEDVVGRVRLAHIESEALTLSEREKTLKVAAGVDALGY